MNPPTFTSELIEGLPLLTGSGFLSHYVTKDSLIAGRDDTRKAVNFFARASIYHRSIKYSIEWRDVLIFLTGAPEEAYLNERELE